MFPECFLPCMASVYYWVNITSTFTVETGSVVTSAATENV